jgi:molybdopterin converting factor small subunit
MPHVVAMGGDLGQFTGGREAFDVAATTVAGMIRELEQRYPGLGDYVQRRMAIAIDGEIYQDADAAVLGARSEVCLIPKIGGG